VTFKGVARDTLRFLMTLLFIKKIIDYLGIREDELAKLLCLNSDMFPRR